jgi:hypothetical protein
VLRARTAAVQRGRTSYSCSTFCLHLPHCALRTAHTLVVSKRNLFACRNVAPTIETPKRRNAENAKRRNAGGGGSEHRNNLHVVAVLRCCGVHVCVQPHESKSESDHPPLFSLLTPSLHLPSKFTCTSKSNRVKQSKASTNQPPTLPPHSR